MTLWTKCPRGFRNEWRANKKPFGGTAGSFLLWHSLFTSLAEHRSVQLNTSNASPRPWRRRGKTANKLSWCSRRWATQPTSWWNWQNRQTRMPAVRSLMPCLRRASKSARLCSLYLSNMNTALMPNHLAAPRRALQQTRLITKRGYSILTLRLCKPR